MKDRNENRPGYKKTKVGWIPQEWGIKILYDICEHPVSGYSAQGADRSAGKDEYGVLKLSCIQNGQFVSSENKLVRKDLIAKLKTPVKKGTLLVSRSNTDELVGAICYVDHDAPNLFLSDLLWEISALDRVSVNLRWISYLLCSEYYRAQIVARANGTSGSMKKITKPSFLGIRIPFPPFPEQRKIAEILSTWDKAIKQIRNLIEAKKRHKKALMQQLLAGNHRLSTATQPWKMYKLFELLEVRNELSNKTNDLLLYSLTIDEGVTPKTDRYNREALVKEKHRKQYKIVFPNDIVFNPPNIRWGAIARSKLNFPVLVSPTYEVLRVKDTSICDPVFLSEVLSTEKQIRKFAARVEGTLVERMAVKLNVFLTTKVNIPTDFVEQKNISAVLSVAENEIETFETKLSALEKQKHGLMQKLLTGEFRVTVVDKSHKQIDFER